MVIKLVIFDLWNTLAYKRGDSHSTIKMQKFLKIKMPHKKFIKIFENSVQTKRWKSEYKAYENLAKNCRVAATKENIEKLIKIRHRAEKNTSLYKHTIPMLRELKNKGYKIALLTNSSVFAINEIKRKTKILDYIDYPVFSYDIGAVKPDLKGYRYILKKSKTKPFQAVMIGDNPEDDFYPAKKIGINSIHFKNYRQLKKELEKIDIKLK